jgi:hypothetical protein
LLNLKAHWYKEDYKKWLAVRGQATDGDKDCLREQVMSSQVTLSFHSRKPLSGLATTDGLFGILSTKMVAIEERSICYTWKEMMPH